MKRILIVAVAAAAILSPMTVSASEPVPYTVYLNKKGWAVTKTHELTADKAAECRGRLVVDHQSPLCKRIPPQRPGGPWGMRCPNKCVE